MAAAASSGGPAVELKIRGVRQLEEGTRRLFANIADATQAQAAQATAEQVALTVRSRVPKKSGRLAASVHVTDHGGVKSVMMGAGIDYARWIEYGGSHGRPYRASGRFLLPTAKRTASAFRKHAETATDGQIRRMTWRSPKR